MSSYHETAAAWFANLYLLLNVKITALCLIGNNDINLKINKKLLKERKILVSCWIMSSLKNVKRVSKVAKVNLNTVRLIRGDLLFHDAKTFQDSRISLPPHFN